MSARNNQIDGDHYRNRAIQPAEFALANNFNYCESIALRYLTRHRQKNGKRDLLKLIHIIELLIELEYDKNENKPDPG